MDTIVQTAMELSIDLSYYDDGQFDTIKRYYGQTFSALGILSTYQQYDGIGRLKSLKHENDPNNEPSDDLVVYAWDYDIASRITLGAIGLGITITAYGPLSTRSLSTALITGSLIRDRCCRGGAWSNS